MKKDLDLDRRWLKLREKLKLVIGKKPADLNGVLFLIGIQELGKGQMSFSKEEKQDLIHLGICKVLSLSGYYELQGLDEEGWPHWAANSNIPNLNLMEQEKLLKMNTIEYFEKEIGLEF
ncbi:hypothetical protein N6H18_05625 [Reichenbachiella agarivorans]|uniref:Uncharacterized protein n=1 Tax=Reichenbachiella agarivorans TaxID=2979464 RepID=A0ABY6CTW3_9BACT|nr:hypothetical protein [Reichenbachiella agarivorans]UXP33430.1 hypothetical protein N6H18_05625 [Reichenbachiella agarivorans]